MKFIVLKNKKVIVVTGSSRGIGKAIILEFANLGYDLVINYNKSKIEAYELLEKINKLNNNSRAIVVKADVSKFSGCKILLDNTIKKFGDIDVLINNAGIGFIKIFQDVSESEWQKLFKMNVGSVFNCSSLAVKYMLRKKSGHIINISSIWGITGASMEVHYSASKSAIIGFTKALAAELAPSGIFVNCIAPGVIDTDMNKNFNLEEIKEICLNIPLNRMGRAEEIAKLIVFLVETSNYITGQVISPNGGLVL